MVLRASQVDRAAGVVLGLACGEALGMRVLRQHASSLGDIVDEIQCPMCGEPIVPQANNAGGN